MKFWFHTIKHNNSKHRDVIIKIIYLEKCFIAAAHITSILQTQKKYQNHLNQRNVNSTKKDGMIRKNIENNLPVQTYVCITQFVNKTSKYYFMLEQIVL